MINTFTPKVLKFSFSLWGLITGLCLTSTLAWAQTPQYHTTGTTGSNVFPFNTSSSNRCQYLILASDLTGTQPLTAGLITHVYFKSSSTPSGTTTYTNLTIDLGNTTITAFPTGPWMTGLTNALSAATYTVATPVVIDEWVQFTLTTPFLYDGTSNIIVDASQTGYTGGFNVRNAGISNSRKFGSVTTTSPTTGSGRAEFGFDLIPAISCADPSITFPTSANAVVDVDTSCVGSDIELSLDTQMPPSANITYQWQSSPSATGPWTNLGTPQMTPLRIADNVTTTTYYRCEVYCNNNLELTSAPAMAFIVTPVVLSTSDSFRCGPGTVILKAIASDNSSLRWYVDDTTSTAIGSGAVFETPLLTETDTFYVSAGVDTGAMEMDCETSREMVIATLLPVPQLDLGGDQNICLEDWEYMMLNAGVHPYDPEYLWNDATTGQILEVDTSGFYYVTVTNDYDCMATDSVSIIIRHYPKLDLGQDTSVCAGSEVTLHAGTDGINYFWNTGDIDSVITVSDSGVYHVIVTNVEGCTKADTIVVHMNGDPPVVQGIIVDNLDRYTFKFEAFNPQNVMGYEWDFGDGSPFAYEAAPVHTYADEGHYIVTLRINSSCGFWGDEVSANVVAVKDVDPGKEQLKVYPNPASHQAKILNESADLKMEEVLMFDALGREVYKRDSDSDRGHTIYFEDLSDGIYTIKIIMDKGMVYRKINVISGRF